MKAFYALGAAIALLSGCATVSVNRDYDDSVDFSRLHTYAWRHDTQPGTGQVRIDNDLLDRRIREAVERELAARRFERAGKLEADFLVAYYIEYKQRISGNAVMFGLGSGVFDAGFGSFGYNAAISDYDEGWLTLYVIDPLRGKTIWRGVGIRHTYESPDPRKVTRVIDKAVARILSGFPPQN